MGYQVWTKEEFAGWTRKDCESLPDAQAELLAALKRGAEPLLTVEVPFDVNIKIKEGKPVEIGKVETKPGEGAGAAGKGTVRRGDTSSVPKLD